MKFIPNFNILLCLGMPRAGSTVQQNVAQHMLGQLGSMIEERQIGGLPKHELERPPELEFVHIYKEHAFHPNYEDVLQNGRAKILYIYRDIRDAVASMMNRAGAPPWKDTLNLCMDCWSNILDVSHKYPGQVLIQRYDCMLIDFSSFAYLIQDFLGIPYDGDSIREAVDKFSISESERTDQSVTAEDLMKRLGPWTSMISPTKGLSIWEERLDQEDLDWIYTNYGSWFGMVEKLESPDF